MQKYRFDKEGAPTPSGAVPVYSEWNFGPSLAGIRNCPIAYSTERRTVYITGEADTYFSIPAVCKIKGKRVKGWLGCEDGEWMFHPSKGEPKCD